MRKPLVTVVIPVYKTEAFLHRCIASAANQTYEALEILLVDDGSPDGCPGICDGWAEKDPRIRVIHQENRGLGLARNTGMAQARGEYLCFLDSDDDLEPRAVENAVDCGEKTGAELVLYGMTCIDAAGAVTARRIPKAEDCYWGERVRDVLLPRLLAGVDGLTMSACCCLFSLGLIRKTDWQFPSEREIISEDVYALLELFHHVERAAVLGQALYRYRENPASLTRRYREDRMEKIEVFYQACLALCRRCGYGPGVQRSCAEPVLSFAVAAMKQEAALGLGALPRLKKWCRGPGLSQALRAGGRKQGWKRRLLFFCLKRRWAFPAWLLLRAQNRLQ